MGWRRCASRSAESRVRACCDENGARGVAEYRLGDAAKQEALDGAETAGAEDDQIDGVVVRDPNELARRVAGCHCLGDLYSGKRGTRCRERLLESLAPVAFRGRHCGLQLGS